MKRHKTYQNLNDGSRGAVVAIGNFDGVHLGHQSVIALARAAAAELSAPLGVLTFEPHPRSYFAPDAPAFRLMNARARAHRLERLGVEHLYELPFGESLASKSADDFIREVLVDGLSVRQVIVGADFRYGKGRKGDPDLLVSAGATHGFRVTIVPLVSDGQGDYSSTAIREALSAGQPEEAARILGHWHRLEGEVVKGDKRGHELGFPTVNIPLEGLHLPKFGVYAVTVEVETGPHKGSYHGAASLGVKPTFGENEPCLETYLFDFSGDLYGASISVALVKFLRPELKFDDIEALIAQMEADCEEARAVLSV